LTEFIYTIHAEKRMRERKISKQLVEDIYYNPDRKYPAEGESERAVRNFGGFEIIVTFEELKRKHKTIKIISTHKIKIHGG